MRLLPINYLIISSFAFSFLILSPEAVSAQTTTKSFTRNILCFFNSNRCVLEQKTSSSTQQFSITATSSLLATLPTSSTQTSPQVIIRYVPVPGPKGEKGDRGDSINVESRNFQQNSYPAAGYGGYFQVPLAARTNSDLIGISTISYINSGTFEKGVYTSTSTFTGPISSIDIYTSTIVATNATATNLIATNSTTTNGFLSSLIATLANISELVVGNSTTTNAVVTNSTTTSAFITSLISANATSTTGFFSNLGASIGAITDLTATNSTTTNLAATNATSTNGFFNNLGAALASITSATFTNSTSTNLVVTNSTTTNSFVSSLVSTLVAITDLTVSNGTTTNLVATNATSTNGFFNNLSATIASLTDATFTNSTSTNQVTTNSTSTNSFISSFVATLANITNLTVTNGTTTNLITTNATSTNSFATTGVVTNLTATSATTTGLAVTGSSTFANAPAFSSLAAGSVAFVGANGVVKESSTKFFFDETNNRLGIGTNTPFETLTVDGTLAVTGTAYNTAGTWSVFSDERLKKDITPYTKGLDFISSIKTKVFSYNDFSGNDTTKRHVGILAQDVAPLAPEMFTKKLMNLGGESAEVYVYNGGSDFIYALINAVQELSEKIKNLKNDRVETKMLCVEDVCVSRDQFLRMVEQAGVVPVATTPVIPEQESDTPLIQEETVPSNDQTETTSTATEEVTEGQ